MFYRARIWDLSSESSSFPAGLRADYCYRIIFVADNGTIIGILEFPLVMIHYKLFAPAY